VCASLKIHTLVAGDVQHRGRHVRQIRASSRANDGFVAGKARTSAGLKSGPRSINAAFSLAILELMYSAANTFCG